MSEEQRGDARCKVTSVGNSWIVCKSKSHSGHVYYFNTLTGEAVWNLSDPEIEKAKRRTKKLECESGIKPTRCPEPKDKPPNTFSNINEAQRTLNEPIVNNLVSEQQASVLKFPNFDNNPNISSPINQMAGLLECYQLNKCIKEPLAKVNSFSNSISTLHLDNTPFYNPKVWAVPHTQQIFISPTMTPLVNHTQTSLNVAYNTLPQTISQHETGLNFNHFDSGTQSGNIRATRNFYPRHYNSGKGQRNTNKKYVFTNKNDLRQKLSAKKRVNVSTNSSEVSGKQSDKQSAVRRTEHKDDDIANEIEGIHSNETADDALEKICIDTQLHETSSKIDLGPLKELAAFDSNPEAWFIVVDLDVLLNEFKFLTTLTDSDEHCHLMVPSQVMTQLKDHVTLTGDIRARRILRFLSQQIEIGYAFMDNDDVSSPTLLSNLSIPPPSYSPLTPHITKSVPNDAHIAFDQIVEEPTSPRLEAEEPSVAEDANMPEVIHCTCTELLARKYHLILLSNDMEILRYKNSSTVNIFSIDEIKCVLKANPSKHPVSVPKKPFLFERLIKITVPNDSDFTNTAEDIQRDDQVDQAPITESETIESITEYKKDEAIVEKRTVDAGIQTDFEDINASFNVSNVLEKQNLEVVSNGAHDSNMKTINRPVSSNLKESDKKREIKLKRSSSYQLPLPAIQSNEKKQFKWRRRRNTNAQPDEKQTTSALTTSEQNGNPEKFESQEKLNRDIYKQSDKLSNKLPTSAQNENNVADDSIESRESSIIYIGQKSSQGNITIEETSTSCIISNTESNVDSSYSNSSVNQLAHNDPSYNKPMYKIDSISMEELLKIKSDEWVSRYIQVMEEALSQVLQQDPPLTLTDMPPPWTLHEAAQCIAVKFHSNKDIKDAANKLSIVLFNISDAKGKINTNLSPYEFMQMYSYGVHLLSAIKKVIENCEDITIAVESLNNLLEDINNPNLDCIANDTFNDNLHEHSANNEVLSVPDDHDKNAMHEQETITDSSLLGVACNLRSKRRLSEEEPTKPVKFIRKIDIKSSFFSNLNLQRTDSNVATENYASCKPQFQSHEEASQQLITDTQVQEENTTRNTNTVENNIVEKEIEMHSEVSNQPKIIRNFSMCAEFEKKLKNKYNANIFDDFHEELDYEEDYDGQYITEEYQNYSEDENDNFQCNDAGIHISNVRTLNENYKPESPKTVDPILINDDTKRFKYMMGMLLKEIKNALFQVRILCDQCYEELKNPDRSTVQTCELQHMAEKAHIHIVRLCKSLESMLDQEANNPNQSMRNLLKQADIHINHVDDNLLFEYRTTVAKCKDHADAFLNSIQNIIMAFND